MNRSKEFSQLVDSHLQVINKQYETHNTNDFLHFNNLLHAGEKSQKKCNVRCDVYKDSNWARMTGLIFRVS